ncbi:hypothetical protein CKN73_01085 [Carnobacterium divergens]|uniref:HEPN domain-containing protein n=1 Tax=Carnobacterium divergens TaxID=2748 RepID=UPI00107225BE|nr:HEPN domain-containing protein [Carnobacterium divergens]TFJ45067.1 hypothetical protein CKN77_01080 [Carnobacterium divergens]TFJ52136.1 hypothetical protein CKN73_01085 [Carnobacterium divergens]TFJ57713.1 hypothetical protein CKN83_01080 [Carnobacterium divergens]TFJ65728.1 hypothetical protein CKN89_01085 [Carnobacterium divergens]TFJ74033.1 hypothetical protein CKN91_01080 [Carnobacterium divergens]
MKLSLSSTGKAKIKGIEEIYDVTIYQNNEQNVTSVYLSVEVLNSQKNKSSATLIPSYIDELEVEISNGAKLLLVGCGDRKHSTTVYASSRVEEFQYFADYIIYGASHVENRFATAIYDIPGIIKWGTKTNFARSTQDEEKRYVDINTDTEIILYESQSYQINYYVSRNYPLDFIKETVELKQTPHIEIESLEGVESIQWFEKKLKEFVSVVELATHKKINYKKISLLKIRRNEINTSENVVYDVDSYLASNEFLEEEYHNNYLFNCVELVNNADLVTWNKKLSKLQPVLDLYREAYYAKYSNMQNHFLNICQALETYHARMVTNSKREYIRLANLKIEGYVSGWKDFLIRDEKKEHILLVERISDLMFTDEPKYFFSGGFNFNEFPQKVSKTRNYYTHYNEKQKDTAFQGEDLITATRLLRLLLEFHLLKELGFKNEDNFKKLMEHFKGVRTSMMYKEALEKSDEINFEQKNID